MAQRDKQAIKQYDKTKEIDKQINQIQNKTITSKLKKYKQTGQTTGTKT